MAGKREAFVHFSHHATRRLDKRGRVISHHPEGILIWPPGRPHADQRHIDGDAATAQKLRHRGDVHRRDVQNTFGRQSPVCSNAIEALHLEAVGTGRR